MLLGLPWDSKGHSPAQPSAALEGWPYHISLVAPLQWGPVPPDPSLGRGMNLNPIKAPKDLVSTALPPHDITCQLAGILWGGRRAGLGPCTTLPASPLLMALGAVIMSMSLSCL